MEGFLVIEKSGLSMSVGLSFHSAALRSTQVSDLRKNLASAAGREMAMARTRIACPRYGIREVSH